MERFRKTIPKNLMMIKKMTHDIQSSSNNNVPIKKADPSIIEEIIPISKDKNKIRKYKIGRFLGKGGFAKCYELVCLDNNKIFAAKMIAKNSIKTERQRQKLITEIKIHKSCHYSNIVAFEHNFEDSDNVYILLELCQNQTLNEIHVRRKTLTELEVQCYIIQLIKAIQYLHSHRIIHRDLKLGNLFLNDKMELKVGDFGLATKLDFDGEKKKTVCGTPNYIAPEVISRTGHSYTVDTWAVGIIIYTLLCGKPPFETKDVKTTYGKIKSADYKFPEHCKISKEAKNLIKKILVVEPKNRPSLKDILLDDFFNQGIAIPKLLPTSTLALKPPKEYIKKYMPNYNSNKDNESNNEENKNNNISNEITDDTENNNNEKSSTSKTRIPLYINGTFSSKMEVWVTKWIDYSSKYGLGYILNNGYYGVYFNDNTKMLLNPFDERFIFVERKITEKQDSLFQFFLKDYPSDLKNKITLFIQFKKFLEENNSNKKKEIVNRNVSPTLRDKRKREKINIKEPENIEVPKIEESNVDFSSIEVKESDFIFIKKWMNTKHAIIFRFSNKIIQTIFKDKTQIIIHGLINKVTYINKKEEKFVYPLNKVFESNNYEMIRRVKYIKEILEHMVNLNKENTKVKDDQKEKEKELLGSTPAPTSSGTTTDKSQIEKETPKGDDKVKEEKQ